MRGALATQDVTLGFTTHEEAYGLQPEFKRKVSGAKKASQKEVSCYDDYFRAVLKDLTKAMHVL